MKLNSKKQAPTAHVPDFAPGPIAHDTHRKYFETGVQPTIERNRWFLVSLIQSGAMVAMAITLYALFPLKQVEPYALQKLDGGRLVVDETPIGKWSPDKDSISYFLNRWANNVFDINRSTIDRTIEESGSIVIGNAVQQLRDLRIRDNPMVLLRDTASFNRAYEYKSINFIKDDVALLRFKTITISNDLKTEVNYVMTVTFTMIKPKTREQLMRNPAGLYITNFHIVEESAK